MKPTSQGLVFVERGDNWTESEVGRSQCAKHVLFFQEVYREALRFWWTTPSCGPTCVHQCGYRKECEIMCWRCYSLGRVWYDSWIKGTSIHVWQVLIHSHHMIGVCRWHRVAFPRLTPKQWVKRHRMVVWNAESQSAAVQISRSALLTAHIIEGTSMSLYPLSSDPPYGLPSANQIKKAGTVFLKEITSAQSQPRVHSQLRNKRKHRDWLVLLLREHLGTVPPTLAKIFPLRILSSGFEICDEHPNTRSPIRRPHT